MRNPPGFFATTTSIQNRNCQEAAKNGRATSSTTRGQMTQHNNSTTTRERVVDHPLKSPSVPENIVTTGRGGDVETGSTSVTSTHCSSLTTAINTASLIQAAARSVLDNTPNSTTTNDISDDEHDESDSGDFYSYNNEDETTTTKSRSSRAQRAPSPTLRSLQRETLPAMPDEQDRKRFVGCLAAILASSYDYDIADDEDETAESRAESYAYLNRSEQEHDNDDDDDEDYTVEGCTQDENVYADEEEHDYSFDDDPSVLYQSCSTSFEYSDLSGGPPPSQYPSTTKSSASPSRSRQYYPSPSTIQQTQQRHRKAPIKPPEREVKKKILARARHRKRRYNVFSQLLLSSAELLLLEKCQAKAFLPLLARLLVPQSATLKAAQKQHRLQRQRERRHQQRKPPLHQNAGNNLQSTPGSATSTPTKSTSTSATSPHENHISPNENKGVNHYHYSPTTTMPIGRSKPLAPHDASLDDELLEYQEEEFLLPSELDEEDHLRPFLESLSPGAGFRCLSLMLLQHLLHSTDGYDARIRHVLKKLGVIVLIHDMEQERELEQYGEEQRENISHSKRDDQRKRKHKKGNKTTSNRPSSHRHAASAYDDLVGPATRKFEDLEHSIAARLIHLSKQQQKLQQQRRAAAGRTAKGSSSRPNDYHQVPPQLVISQDITASFSREQLVRGLKIGSAGLVAGSLFAVTGGLAAPGIAAGLAAIAGSTAATAAVVSIVSSTPAVVSIFGVGGGSLAAYKVQRRIQGLTEFEFRREERQVEQQKLAGKRSHLLNNENDDEEKAELFSTICVSGWLRDECDFQRPWGIAPSDPPLEDRLELLERFYSVYRPDHVPKCKSILGRWKGEEKQLWKLLRQKYGRDPDHLFPLQPTHCDGFHRGLTLDQEEVLNRIFVELGYVASGDEAESNTSVVSLKQPAKAFENMRQRVRNPYAMFTNSSDEYDVKDSNTNLPKPGSHLLDKKDSMTLDSLHGPALDGLSYASSGFDSVGSSTYATANMQPTEEQGGDDKEPYVPPKHLATVWDYHATYGGEVYTVRWESEMLAELCDSVTDMAFDVINGATAQILRQTAFSTLLSAVAIPYALINAANLIDGTWTLAVERADEAGKELARSLLFSRAGHRPVTLVGFSFGARTIYSCLKELARYQEKWENSRERHKNNKSRGPQPTDYCADPSAEYSWKMREPASIVEDVIIMGLPNHLSLMSWKACRQVVGGRLVNCYSRKDLILSLMFQFKRLAGGLKPVCGTCPVNIPGVENVDVSDLVLGHQDYCTVTGEILKRVRHGQPFRSSLRVVSKSGNDRDPVESTQRRIEF